MIITSEKKFKNNFDDYIKSLDTNREIAVTRDEGENFFVVSESYLNSLKESLYIESIPNLKEKILEVIKNKEKIMKLYRKWKKSFDKEVEILVEEFINN